MLKFDRSPGNYNCGNEQTSMDQYAFRGSLIDYTCYQYKK